MATPTHVRLAERLNRGIIADVEGGSGWSIAGLDVKEVPSETDEPAAHRFVTQALRQGKLEAASAGEYQEVQAANEKIAEAGAFDPEEGESLNEAAVQAAVRQARKELSEAAASREAAGDAEVDEFDGMSRDELVEYGNDAYELNLAKNVSRAEALAAVRSAAAAEDSPEA
jgi:hypothetical protein